jgi:hypothetical protein
MCERIWEVKRVIDDAEKVAQLEIMFRNHVLDWYMNLAVNNPQGGPGTLEEIKHARITKFQRSKSEDQFMNEMSEFRQKPREFVWDIDHKFKTLKGKLKYPIFDMQHKKLFINSLLPHFKYPLRQKKFQTQAEEL